MKILTLKTQAQEPCSVDGKLPTVVNNVSGATFEVQAIRLRYVNEQYELLDDKGRIISLQDNDCISVGGQRYFILLEESRGEINNPIAPAIGSAPIAAQPVFSSLLAQNVSNQDVWSRLKTFKATQTSSEIEPLPVQSDKLDWCFRQDETAPAEKGDILCVLGINSGAKLSYDNLFEEDTQPVASLCMSQIGDSECDKKEGNFKGFLKKLGLVNYLS